MANNKEQHTNTLELTLLEDKNNPNQSALVKSLQDQLEMAYKSIAKLTEELDEI